MTSGIAGTGIVNVYRERKYLFGLMKDKIPLFGYWPLASVLTRTESRIVITTNFDELTETAINYFTNDKCNKVTLAEDFAPLDIITDRPRLLKLHLGLSEEIQWCKGADRELCDELMESLLSSGNFDQKRGKGSSVESVTSNIARKGLFRYLQIAGEFNWKAYHKHKWLKPFCWIYQIGRYARRGLQAKRNRKQLKEDVARGKDRVNLWKKLKIGQ